MTRSIRFALALVFTLAIAPAAPALAGTVSLAWDPVSHPSLGGYRVYYGTSAGNYTANVNAGLTPLATLSGLNDCTTYYTAVKAFATDGSESATFSNAVSGWARPTLQSASPAALQRGAQVDVTLAGTNFQAGATVQVSNPGVTVGTVTVGACQQLVVRLNASASAALGAFNVTVVNPGGVFGTGTGLVSVTADATAPVISAVQSSNVAATSATVTWTTNEASDSQVFFRRQGDTTYQQTTVATALVTSHALALGGLVPEATYEFHVRSADATGNAATSTPDATLSTTASSFLFIRVEAESGSLVAPVQVAAGTGAFEGEWITTPSGTATGTATNPAGTATYGFYVPRSATWRVWVRMFGPNGSSNAMYEAVDAATLQQIQTVQTGAWEWVGGGSYALAPGLHTLRLGGREAQARADRILITDDAGFTPTEQPGSDVTPPPPVTSFTVTAGVALNQLAWVNPSGSDAARVVVRFRTDAAFPLSPIDGLPLSDAPAVAGPATAQHTGLTNGTAYRYAIFTLDATGNVSTAATGQGTPQPAVTPPGTVTNLRRTDTQ